jgi:hypothetical protein
MSGITQQIIPVRPTVFVGLGGTGKEILLRLRMKFYERYGAFGYPCMSYVWVDTDMQNLNVDKKDMDPILQKARLSLSEIVDIQVGDPSDFLNNPGKFSWITRWMPPAVVQSGLRIQDGAGQVRSKGRFSFYWKFRDVQSKLLHAVTKVRAPQAKPDTDRFSEEHRLNLSLDPDWGTKVNFFIASSLAGGTGSGTFIDMPFLIRQLASEQAFKPDITGLLFLSSLFTNDPTDRRFANTYAALKELEYYNYTPEAGARDVETVSDDHVYALRKFEEKWEQNYPQLPVNGPPYNTCYLIDGYTFGGTPVTPDHKHEVFDMASEYLFWEFYRGDFASQKRTLRPNNRQYLDRNHPEPHGPEGTPFHTQRFSTGYSSFGLSWIRVPLGSRIAACAYRLNQEILEYWERGGLMTKKGAEDKLRERNVVDEVRKAARGEPLNMSGQRIVEDLAATKDGTRFSALLKSGIDQFSDQQDDPQSPAEFATVFEDRYLARRQGAVINDNIDPSKNRVLGNYRSSLLKWIVSALETEGFIPLLGFTYNNPDGTQGRVSGYLDILTEVVLEEFQSEVESIKESFGDKKATAEEDKETFFNNFDDLDGSFVLFRNMTRKILLRKCMESEQNYAEGDVGEWVCDVAQDLINGIKQYVREIKTRLKAFYDSTLTPIIGEFSDLRRRYEIEEKPALSINLYKKLDEYYRLGGDPVDVREEKEQLFKEKMPNLWEVITQFTPEKFKEEVEQYGWQKFQNDFSRRLATGAEDEPLANAVQLFNEVYPPSNPTQRRNQISIFLEGGKPYVQPRMTLGPRAPKPHEDIIVGMKGTNPPALPGSGFFNELRTQHNLGQAQGIEAEPEAILYYHELTGLPLFYLSSLEQYRQSYDTFQSRLGDLPVHFHRRVDMFPEIFLYTPQEARGMFNAWQLIILGTLLRVLQVESSSDDFRYFYYAGAAADTRSIGDEKGSVRTLFVEPSRFAWCTQEIDERKRAIYQDIQKLEVYYGLLQILARDVYTDENIVLAGGNTFRMATFQSSVVAAQIHEAESTEKGRTLPRRKPGTGQTSPEWDALMNEATLRSESVKINRDGREEFRFFMNGVDPFTVR